jgi:hypothetical protein
MGEEIALMYLFANKYLSSHQNLKKARKEHDSVNPLILDFSSLVKILFCCFHH